MYQYIRLVWCCHDSSRTGHHNVHSVRVEQGFVVLPEALVGLQCAASILFETSSQMSNTALQHRLLFPTLKACKNTIPAANYVGHILDQAHAKALASAAIVQDATPIKINGPCKLKYTIFRKWKCQGCMEVNMGDATLLLSEGTISILLQQQSSNNEPLSEHRWGGGGGGGGESYMCKAGHVAWLMGHIDYNITHQRLGKGANCVRPLLASGEGRCTHVVASHVRVVPGWVENDHQPALSNHVRVRALFLLL